MPNPDFTIEFHGTTAATMRYTVRELSKMQTIILSPPCYVLNLPWKMMLIPRLLPYKNKRLKKYLGLFLQCNGVSTSRLWSCFATAELRLLSEVLGIEHCRRRIRHLFTAKMNDWGYSYFMPWCDILNPRNGFIKDDTVTLEIQFATETPDENFGILLDYSLDTCRVCVSLKIDANGIQVANGIEKNYDEDKNRYIKENNEAEEKDVDLERQQKDNLES